MCVYLDICLLPIKPLDRLPSKYTHMKHSIDYVLFSVLYPVHTHSTVRTMGLFLQASSATLHLLILS